MVVVKTVKTIVPRFILDLHNIVSCTHSVPVIHTGKSATQDIGNLNATPIYPLP